MNHMVCYWDHARLYGDGRCSAVDTLSRWRHFLLGEELKICSRNEPQLASSVCRRRAVFHQRGRNLIREREQQRNGGSFSFLFFNLYELTPWGVVILAWRLDSLYHHLTFRWKDCQLNSHLLLLVYVWNVKGRKIKLCLSFYFSAFQHGLDSLCGLVYLTLPSRRWSSPVGIPHALSCELWDNYPAGLAPFPSVIIASSGNKATRSLCSLQHSSPHQHPSPHAHHRWETACLHSGFHSYCLPGRL